MNDEFVYGVFVEGATDNYLIAAFDHEDEAIAYAEHADEEAFEQALEDGEELTRADFEGLHKVAPVFGWSVDWKLLECGFAQVLDFPLEELELVREVCYA